MVALENTHTGAGLEVRVPLAQCLSEVNCLESCAARAQELTGHIGLAQGRGLVRVGPRTHGPFLAGDLVLRSKASGEAFSPLDKPLPELYYCECFEGEGGLSAALGLEVEGRSLAVVVSYSDLHPRAHVREVLMAVGLVELGLADVVPYTETRLDLPKGGGSEYVTADGDPLTLAVDYLWALDREGVVRVILLGHRPSEEGCDCRVILELPVTGAVVCVVAKVPSSGELYEAVVRGALELTGHVSQCRPKPLLFPTLTMEQFELLCQRHLDPSAPTLLDIRSV